MRLSHGSFVALVWASAVTLGSCSQFNMVPPCESAARGVALAMIPNNLIPAGGHIDQARVLSAVSVTDLSEVTSGYNSRTCKGVIALSDGSARFRATFKLNQSEGAQGWQEIKFLDSGNPEFDKIIAGVHRTYVAGNQ